MENARKFQPFLMRIIRGYANKQTDFFAERKMYSIFALAFRGISSAGSEHLPYKQRVGGSNPSSPTYKKPDTQVAGFYF
jgi:hypothetical protein